MITIEHTDTFQGESNYCWVNRWHCKAELTDKQAVRLAKKLAGLTGHRCEVSYYGDMIDIRPRRMCQVIFVGYDEADRAERHGVEIDSHGDPVESEG